jgi:hypothetical protein
MSKTQFFAAAALTLVLAAPAFAQDAGGAASVGAGTTGVVSLGSSVDTTASTSASGSTATGGDINTGISSGVGIGVAGGTRPVVAGTIDGNAQTMSSGGGTADTDGMGNRNFEVPSNSPSSSASASGRITGDFKSLDANSDQYVNSAEFRANAQNSPSRFNNLDINTDGKLSEMELKAGIDADASINKN